MGLFGIASETLASSLTEEEISLGLVLPKINRIREVAKAIAVQGPFKHSFFHRFYFTQNVSISVCREANSAGLSTKSIPNTVEELNSYVEESMYVPFYTDLVPKRN